MKTELLAMIVSHGRPDKVITLEALRKHGWTGPVCILIDNEDPTGDRYRANYPGLVQVFDKAAIAARIDDGDNFGRRGVVYARNAAFDVAQAMSYRYFIVLDDDYTAFWHKRDAEGTFVNGWKVRDLDAVLGAMLDWFKTIPALSIAMAQTGDFPGGVECGTRYQLKRKAMNSFLCDTERRFEFVGRVNEDVNAYISLSPLGHLFFTVQDVALMQVTTQKSAGGMTDLYLESGTYVKSFYTVMYHPSATRVGFDPAVNRIHHRLRWRFTGPCILHEQTRKT
jgi:hypothetical protein